MARSGKQFAKISGDYSTSFIGTWALKSQDIENNNSTFLLRGYFYYGGGTEVSSTSSTFKLHGKTVKTGSYAYEPGDHLLGTNEVTVAHNEDGSFPGKSLSLYAKSYHMSGSTTGTIDSADVPDIPRASSVTATDANIGSVSSINISRASANFTHTLFYSIDNGTNWIEFATGVETSYGWTIPTDFYNSIPDSKSLTCKIKCQTYNGETLIGEKETSFKVTVDEETNKPDVSATIKDINTVSTTLTGDTSKIVKYVSNVQVSISATAKNGASIVSKSVTCGDGKSLTENGTIEAVESATFTAKATDSRGISNSVVINGLTLIEYIKLTLNANFYRVQPTTGEIALTFKGNYFNNSFGKTSNTLSLKYRYKVNGTDSWSSYANLTPMISENTYSNGENAISLGSNFDYQLAYDFEIVATDKIGSYTFKQTVTKGIPNFDWGKDDFKHNTTVYHKSGNEIYDSEKISDNVIRHKDKDNNVIYVCPYFPVGYIMLTLDENNPSIYYGGTWEKLGARFLMGAGTYIGEDGNEYTVNAGDEGGEYLHQLTESEMPSHTHIQNQHRHRIGRDDTSAGSGSYTFGAGKVSGALAIGSSDSTYDFDDGTDQYTRYTTPTNQNTGGDAYHNNLPAHLVVNMWKKTSD